MADKPTTTLKLVSPDDIAKATQPAPVELTPQGVVPTTQPASTPTSPSDPNVIPADAGVDTAPPPPTEEPPTEPVAEPVEPPAAEPDKIDLPDTGALTEPGTQVAGAVTELLSRLRATPKAPLDQPLARAVGNKLTGRAGEYVISREATPAEAAAFADHMASAGVPTGKPGAMAWNYDLMATPDGIKKSYEAVGKAFERADKTPVTWAETEKLAQEAGVDGSVQKLLRRSDRQALNATDLHNGVMTVIAHQFEVDRLAKVAATTGAPADEARFVQALALQAALQDGLEGAISETARSLNILKAFRAVDMNRVEDMRAILDQFGGAEAVTEAAKSYLALPRTERAKFADLSMAEKIKDTWGEAFIGAKLYNPVTHLKNMTGNTINLGLQPLLYTMAGGFGKVRTLMPWVTDPTDRVYIGEGLAMLMGMKDATGDAFRIASRAFMEEASQIDAIGRIEAGQRRAITAETWRATGTAGKAIDYYGVAVRGGSRAMMAEDELFKVFAMSGAQHALGYRRAMQAIEGGATVEEAAAKAAQVIAKPDAADMAAMRDFARYVTFTSDLPPGILAKLGPVMQSPVIKAVVPFYRTPVNVALQTLEYLPFNPANIRTIARGGAQADLALAKISLGATVLGGFAYMAAEEADGFKVTGGWPNDPGMRASWEALGIQPYSFAFKQADGKYRSVSYQGFEPVGPLIGIAADYTQYAQFEHDKNAAERLATAATLGVADYVGTMPMLQGVGDLHRLIESYQGMTPTQRFEATANHFGKLAGNATIGSVLPAGTLTAQAERIIDPTKRNTMSDIADLPPGIKGFYEALREQQAKLPVASDGLEPALDILGRHRFEGTGHWWEAALPVRISENPNELQPFDTEFIRLGTDNEGKAPLEPIPKKIEGVDLTDKQYNRLILISANEIIDNGKDEVTALNKLVTSDEYQHLEPAQKMAVIRKTHSAYLGAARRVLLKEDGELAAKVARAKDEKRTIGHTID